MPSVSCDLWNQHFRLMQSVTDCLKCVGVFLCVFFLPCCFNLLVPMAMQEVIYWGGIGDRSRDGVDTLKKKKKKKSFSFVSKSCGSHDALSLISLSPSLANVLGNRGIHKDLSEAGKNTVQGKICFILADLRAQRFFFLSFFLLSVLPFLFAIR